MPVQVTFPFLLLFLLFVHFPVRLSAIPLSLPAGSKLCSARGVAISSIPAISASVPVFGRNFVIGPGFLLIPCKLLTMITGGQFIELVDLLPDNLKANEVETQTSLDGKLEVALARKRTVEFQDVLT